MKLINNLYLYPECGMLDCNTYVIIGDPGVIIDPGNTMFLNERLESMRQDGLAPSNIGTITNTHLHIDHCGANEAFKNISGAKIILHPVQKANYDFTVIEGARIFGMTPTEFTEDAVFDGPILTIGDMEWEMITAPGHSPDSVCFYNGKDKILICGDVLFEMNTGRVDLPGGNGDELKKTIMSLSKMDIDYLFPGHMGTINGADKVRANFEFIIGNVFPWL